MTMISRTQVTTLFSSVLASKSLIHWGQIFLRGRISFAATLHVYFQGSFMRISYWRPLDSLANMQAKKSMCEKLAAKSIQQQEKRGISAEP